MSIIIFIIILGVLIFVHELGHFLIAKWAKIRVDEFAIGFPPKIFSFKKPHWETRYSLNLIPFGGYVKIFGETPDEDSLDPEAKNSFVNKNRWIQAAVLIAGIAFNIIFAWILFSIGFLIGSPSIIAEEQRAQVADAGVVITGVAPDSPALDAGMRIGDRILSLSVTDIAMLSEPSVTGLQAFVKEHQEQEISITVLRNGEETALSVTPEAGLVEGRKTIGITMDLIGELRLGFLESFWEGAKKTAFITEQVAIGLSGLVVDLFKGDADLEQVSGPVGIVSHVDDASQFGWVYLLSFTAFISLNLAVLNLIPFPALDGGRLLFVLIEGITRRRIKPVVANVINGVGFLLLIGLMILVTISDVIKLF